MRLPGAERGTIAIYANDGEAARHHLSNHHGEVVQTFEPQLDDPQRHVLDLLDTPRGAYLSPPNKP